MKPQHEPTLLRNAFTVDVEEYFQVYALSSRIQKEQWPSLASRLQPVIEQLLELLSSRQMVATFF
ncbi:MAG: polysaccharide deacetylase family protein, partial [Magnetococcales bacterium]|nr:polysaccharide deacetylase family protein [Magnetococcales bacterium]